MHRMGLVNFVGVRAELTFINSFSFILYILCKIYMY